MDNLYILRTYGKNDTAIKFGYSSNINKRILSYRLSNPLVEVVGTFYRPDAKLFEEWFHKKYKSQHGNEWYSENMLNIILNSIIEYPIKLNEFKFDEYENYEFIPRVNNVNNNHTKIKNKNELKTLLTINNSSYSDVIKIFTTEFNLKKRAADYRLSKYIKSGLLIKNELGNYINTI